MMDRLAARRALSGLRGRRDVRLVFVRHTVAEGFPVATCHAGRWTVLLPLDVTPSMIRWAADAVGADSRSVVAPS